MTRVLVTGASGMLGSELVRAAPERVVGRTRAQLDIADTAAVVRTLAMERPQVLVNAAGYTHVDEAERDVPAARNGNVDGPACLANACAAQEIPIIHVSTDYVFDGRGIRPYRPDDSPAPLGVYGRTKWEGEQAVRAAGGKHVIVRTSWLHAAHGRNFVRTIARLAREREELAVVADQRGSPTQAGELARALLRAADALAIGAAQSGTHHFCNAGETSWHDLAETVVRRLAGQPGVICRRVRAIQTAEFATQAPRPAYSTLDTSSWVAAFGLAPRPWRAALEETLCELT